MSNISQIDELMTYEELRELLTNTRVLTPPQYLLVLKRIQKSSVIRLALQLETGEAKGTLSLMQIIERSHYLIDSTEPKAQAAGLGIDGNSRTCVGYEISDDEAALEKLFNADADADA